jgi:hypothetical protein
VITDAGHATDPPLAASLMSEQAASICFLEASVLRACRRFMPKRLRTAAISFHLLVRHRFHIGDAIAVWRALVAR